MSFIILCSLAACGQQNSVAENTAEATAPETTAAEPTTSAELEETIRSHDFEGVIYAVRDGKVIVEPCYDIIEIPNPSKDLFICKNNYDTNRKEYSVQVFNKDKKQILYQYYIVEAIELNNVDDNGFYEKSVLKYKSNGLYGLIDFNGKKITKAEYESIEGFEFNEGLMLVKKSGKYGIININGAVVLKGRHYSKMSIMTYTELKKKRIVHI